MWKKEKRLRPPLKETKKRGYEDSSGRKRKKTPSLLFPLTLKRECYKRQGEKQVSARGEESLVTGIKGRWREGYF